MTISTKISKTKSIQLTSVRKFVSDGKRKIHGLASSISVDRVGDIVEPRGGNWKLPVPLLWAHSHKDPVGWVHSIEVRGDGLWIEAEFAKGVGRADEIWQMVDAGLVDSYSIGFRPIESKQLPSGGLRFTKWELLEISVVSVPAQPDAKISRKKHSGPVKLISPGSVPLLRSSGRKRTDGSVRLIKSRQSDGAIQLIGSNRSGGGIPLAKTKHRDGIPLIKPSTSVRLLSSRGRKKGGS